MNDARNPSDNPAALAKAELGHLSGQVEVMRAVLVQLLQDIVRADSRLDQSQTAQLLETNEQLVVSALDAQSDAEIANGALDEASRTGGLDPLTGLPNRARLLDRFESAIFNAKRRGTRVAILFLDLDAFKRINDTFGHAAGDRTLQRVADCLVSLVREVDTVSRHGGDEFLVLLSEVASAADAALVAGKIKAGLQACSPADNDPGGLAASIGISVYPEDGDHAKVLIDRADTAMYRAKREGPGGFAFHDALQSKPVAVPKGAAHSPHDRFAQHESLLLAHDQRHELLREANEKLVLAALGAQELLAAAQEVARRQSQLLALVSEELGNPYAPIRLAASTLGIPGAEATLLPRVQAVIEAQADKMLRTIKEALEQGRADARPRADKL